MPCAWESPCTSVPLAWVSVWVWAGAYVSAVWRAVGVCQAVPSPARRAYGSSPPPLRCPRRVRLPRALFTFALPIAPCFSKFIFQGCHHVIVVLPVPHHLIPYLGEFLAVCLFADDGHHDKARNQSNNKINHTCLVFQSSMNLSGSRFISLIISFALSMLQ